jgi:hypothetical protein
MLSVCLCIPLPIVARQQHSINVTAAKNTYATIEELVDASFSMQSVSFKREVDDYIFPELVVYFLINVMTKHFCTRL